MKILIATAALALLAPAALSQAATTKQAGQEATSQDPKKQESKKQDPKQQDPKKQDPKKQDPKKGDPKKQDPKKDPKKDPVIEKPPEDQPMPAGADPSDIAAMRSARAMIDAERKLARMLKDGKIKGLDQIVTFDELESWPYEDALKGLPKSIKKLDGKKVLMTGFMLPIDEVENIKEFLLVQSLWSCCYGQPPDINGIVRVVMPKGKTTDYFFDPLKLIGTFKVEACILDGYCVDIYQLHLESLETIK